MFPYLFNRLPYTHSQKLEALVTLKFHFSIPYPSRSNSSTLNDLTSLLSYFSPVLPPQLLKSSSNWPS